jgi:hypothetical protein
VRSTLIDQPAIGRIEAGIPAESSHQNPQAA